MLNCSSLSTSAVATSKASVYSALLDQILSATGWSSASTFASFTTNLLMLIGILQKMFEICILGDYCVIDTLQTKCCAAEYGFCVEFVTCMQCAWLRPQCGDGIEYENQTRLTCKLKFDWNSIRHQALRDYMPSLLKPTPLFWLGLSPRHTCTW